jgi:hypothetical protein
MESSSVVQKFHRHSKEVELDERDISHDPGVRKGEEIEDAEAKESGRRDTGTQYQSQRPTGTSDARDFTSVDPRTRRRREPSRDEVRASRTT